MGSQSKQTGGKGRKEAALRGGIAALEEAGMSRRPRNPRYLVLGVALAALIVLGGGVGLGLVPTGFGGAASNFTTAGAVLGVTVYKSVGDDMDIGQGHPQSIPRLSDLPGGWDNAITVIRVPSNTTAAIYTGANYEGECVALNGANSDDQYTGWLRSVTGFTWYKEISSIRVGTPETNCDSVTLYGNYNASLSEGAIVLDRNAGELRTQLFDSDMPPFQKWDLNDKASSVRLRPNVRAELWENENYSGRCFEATSAINNLGVYNDIISSVRVAKMGDPNAGGWDAAGVFASDPAAVHFADSTHVVARTAANKVWHRWRNGCTWSNVEDMGAPAGTTLVGKPAVASWGPNRMDIFVRGADGALYQKWWDGSRWSDWVKLSANGQLTGDPAAVSWGHNRIDIFAKGNPDGLWHLWWDGTKWNQPENLGGIIIGAPTVSTWGVNRLDVFVRSQGDALFQKWFDGAWHDWVRLSDFNAIHSDPAAVASEPGVINVMAKASDNRLWHRWYNVHGWSNPETLDASLVGAPALASQGKGLVEVFARSGANRLLRKSFIGSQWGDWTHAPNP